MNESEQATYFQLLRDLFHRAPIIAHIPQRMTSISPGEVTIELPFDERLCHGGGAVHGGVTMMLLDNAGYFACATESGGRWVSTAELKVNLLEAVQGRTLVATGRVLRKGRNLMHAEARVFVQRDLENTAGGRSAHDDDAGPPDGGRQLVAVALGTWTVLPRPFRAPPES